MGKLIERQTVPTEARGVLKDMYLTSADGSKEITLTLHFSNEAITAEAYRELDRAICEGSFRLGPYELSAPTSVEEAMPSIDLAAAVARVDEMCSLIHADVDALTDAGRHAEAMRLLREAPMAALALLAADEGARISSDRDPMTLRLAGIRSSSTGGPLQLLLNWRNAAARKLGKAA
jgi:hypothetical protein